MRQLPFSLVNPFERYDIDPLAGPAAITERLRELVEAADDDAERDALRAVWEELTTHPKRRLAHALDALPETRAALGTPPAAPAAAAEPLTLTPADLVSPPSVLEALAIGRPQLPPALPPLEADPHLRERGNE